ncbi:unnamed protein product [Prunus armeniaca]
MEHEAHAGLGATWPRMEQTCAQGRAWKSRAQGRRMEALGFRAEALSAGPCTRHRLALGKQATCAGLDHKVSTDVEQGPRRCTGLA